MSQAGPEIMAEAKPPERRRHPRYRCEFPAEIRCAGQSFPSQGATTDVSLSGCYISMHFNHPVGTKLELKMWVDGVPVRTNAIVRTSDPGVGNGIEFMDIDSAGVRVLSQHFEKLEAGSPQGKDDDLGSQLIFCR